MTARPAKYTILSEPTMSTDITKLFTILSTILLLLMVAVDTSAQRSSRWNTEQNQPNSKIDGNWELAHTLLSNVVRRRRLFPCCPQVHLIS
jgi:hypothetical protein